MTEQAAALSVQTVKQFAVSTLVQSAEEVLVLSDKFLRTPKQHEPRRLCAIPVSTAGKL